MSLKPDKSARDYESRRGHSITARLTLFHTVSGLALILAVMAFLYFGLINHINREDEEFLEDKLAMLRAGWREHALSAVANEVQESKLAKQAYYARILDANDAPVTETPGMAELLPREVFPAPNDGRTAATASWKAADGREFLLMASHGKEKGAGAEGLLFHVALDRSKDQELVAKYQRMFWLVPLFGAAFAAGSGFLLARRALRPVREITTTAEKITATQLHERISPAGWPKELSALAGAFDGMLRRLEDSFTRLSRFSSDLAHELRTPITNVRSEVEITLAKRRPIEEYEEVLLSVLEEHDRLSGIIASMLFLARAENAELGITRKAFNVLQAMEDICEYHRAEAEEQGVRLSYEGSNILHADPILFRRALNNLVSNALKYSSRGGAIQLYAQQENGPAIRVSVRDTGLGIAPEHLPKIFDRFYRADPSRSHERNGTGLGLAIVQSIVQLHGGTVSVKSELGKGTEVFLLFPQPRDGGS